MRSLLLALAVLLAGSPAAPAAQPGTLDRSFGSDGGVQTRVDDVPAVAGLEVLPGGRIVLAGTVGDQRAVLLRWGADGERRGIASLSFAEGIRLHETLLTPSGHVLLAGSVGADAAVLKVSPAGELDQSFGQGGIWRIDLGGAVSERATGLALQADGRLLVAIDIAHGQRSTGSWSDLAVARLTGAGQLDASWAQAGVRRIDGTTSEPIRPIALALDAQERVLVAFMSGYTPKMAVGSGVLRMTSGGSVDATYGGILGPSLSGLIFSLGEPIAYDMAFDPAGDRVLLTGSTYIEEDGSYAFVGSTRPRSQPNPNYPAYIGDQASLRLTASGGWGSALMLDPAGSVLVGGNLGGTASLIARATSELRLDRGFGQRGRGLVKGRLTTLGAMALQPDGGIVAAGPIPIEHPKSKERAFRLVRLHGGYDRAGPRFSIRLSDDRCGGRVRISVRARDESPLRRLRVRIDGRRLAAVRRKRVTIVARVAPLAGVHKVVARAYDVAGNLGVRSRSFTCPS